jgi:hypothetical protein
MITAVIVYRNNETSFVSLLTQLQTALSQDDDIYIIDTSPKKDAVKLATIYGTTRCYIFVEPARKGKTLEYGIQSMVDNNQKACVFFNERCFISATLIQNLKKAIGTGFSIVSPVVVENVRYRMDCNFKFFNPPNKIKESEDFSLYCYMVVRDEDSERYGTLENEVVVLLKDKHPAESTR